MTDPHWGMELDTATGELTDGTRVRLNLRRNDGEIFACLLDPRVALALSHDLCRYAARAGRKE